MKNDTSKTYAFYDKQTMLKKNLAEFPYQMVLGSALFWLVLISSSYFGYMYITLYLEILDDTDLSMPCSDLERNSQTNNINIVKSYPVGEAEPYLISFGLKEDDLKPASSVAEQPLPFLVTAVTSSQFYQVQSLVRHVNEDLSAVKDLTFVVYDIGLTEKEYELLRDQCQCIVRRFRFNPYPDHVKNIKNNAWRPLIVQEVLKETGSVILIEPTTRFKKPSSFTMFRNPGNKLFYLWDIPNDSVIGYTHPKMFSYFQENRCVFMNSKMISTEIMAFYKSDSTWHQLIKPWIICAINEDCISPKGARHNYCFNLRHPKTTGCHRFDQSALSIIANRAYQLTSNRNKNIPPRVTFFDDSEEKYFEEQPALSFWWIILCILILVLFVRFCRRRRCS